MSRYTQNYTNNTNNIYTVTNINNLFDKNVWGPKLWEIMHTFSFSYPDTPSLQHKQSAFNFFSSIGLLIPCTNCSMHCKEYIYNNQPNVNSKNDLIMWVFNFHNEVNKRLNKSQYSINDLYNKYDKSAFCS